MEPDNHGKEKLTTIKRSPRIVYLDFRFLCLNGMWRLRAVVVVESFL